MEDRRPYKILGHRTTARPMILKPRTEDRGPRTSEAGFTLAGLIVLLTIISITIAYTVPRQWSIAAARERDQQTLFAMKQYARAIYNFQYAKNNPAHAYPTSLDQLKQARNPRLIRG